MIHSKKAGQDRPIFQENLLNFSLISMEKQ